MKVIILILVIVLALLFLGFFIVYNLMIKYKRENEELDKEIESIKNNLEQLKEFEEKETLIDKKRKEKEQKIKGASDEEIKVVIDSIIADNNAKS
jgi:uncharacterized protein YneF (UPF0154 family)